MKIRNGFVTNSSSSSFIVIDISSSPIKKFFKENHIPSNFFNMLAEQIEEAYGCSPEMFKHEYHNLTETILYCIDFACALEDEDCDFDDIKHFPEQFCDIGNVPAEKVEQLYNFIHEYSNEINNDALLNATIMATEIATDGGGEGSYYEVRAKNGKQTAAMLDLWDDVMSPLYDNDEDEEADEMIESIFCGEADLWEMAEGLNRIKEL